MIAFGLMLALGGVIMLICAAVLAIKKHSFTSFSEPVTAEIVKKQSRNGKNGKIYELKVSYNVSGIEYEKYLRTNLRDFSSLALGDPLELFCKPGNPKNVLRPEATDSKSIRVVLLVGITMTAIGVALFLLGQ